MSPHRVNEQRPPLRKALPITSYSAPSRPMSRGKDGMAEAENKANLCAGLDGFTEAVFVPVQGR